MTRTHLMRIFLLAGATSLAAACGNRNADSDLPPAAVAEAESIFANRCTPCHGASGGGDGPASATLTPRPRNFHDKVWQAAVNDEHIQKIIQYGGAAVGKSPAMPANPDLGDKYTVVAALKNKIRTFGRQ